KLLLILCIIFSLCFLKSATLSAGDTIQLSPWRCLFSISLPVLIVRHALRKKSLDRSGALAALLVGVLLTAASFCFFLALFIFFVSSTCLTWWRADMKKKIDPHYQYGGQRNWLQVFCNGGIPSKLALIYLVEVGPRELPIDFSKHYTSSWLCLAVIAAIATSAGDTWASEVGLVFAAAHPRLITTWCRVPPGGQLCFLLTLSIPRSPTKFTKTFLFPQLRYSHVCVKVPCNAQHHVQLNHSHHPLQYIPEFLLISPSPSRFWPIYRHNMHHNLLCHHPTHKYPSLPSFHSVDLLADLF
uniref:Transmembrane protein 19 n=1 Tax=Eptatretus burgeri TaxID=7764 RepID=A0A8C4QZP9_EPTBU